MFNIENIREPLQNLVYTSKEALEKQSVRSSYAALQQQLNTTAIGFRESVKIPNLFD
jgi:hypothetical protein